MDIKNIFEFPITEEQKDVIRSASEDILLIDAVAGAAKTSTCQLIAANYIEKTLYLAYNKMMADEASSKFPSHVSCLTTHALAYRACGGKYRHKLSRPKGRYIPMNYTTKEVSRLFKLQTMDFGGLDMSDSNVSNLIISTVSRFEQSDRSAICNLSFPKNDCVDILVKAYTRKCAKLGVDNVESLDVDKLADAISNFVVPKAKMLWDKRVDTNDQTMISHDTYLKIFQLSKPNLGYDRVILDEAQDTNPCVMDIFINQSPKSKLVAVGDKRQQIYKWRGAVNALEKMKGKRLSLTQSFRYGQRVADIAMGILSGSVKIKGFDKFDTQIAMSSSVNSAGCACIYRGNASIIVDSIIMMQSGMSVFINIDVYDMVKLIKSMVCLREGNLKGVTHSKALSFSSFEDAIVEAKKDKELSRVVKLITNGLEIRSGEVLSPFDVIELLSEYDKPSYYDVFMTTAHKSKGLEFDYVMLGHDFLDADKTYSEDGTEIRNEGFYNDEFRNLCYVAATRAKYGLAINSSVLRQIQVFIEDGASRHKELKDRLKEIQSNL